MNESAETLLEPLEECRHLATNQSKAVLSSCGSQVWEEVHVAIVGSLEVTVRSDQGTQKAIDAKRPRTLSL